MAFQIDLKSEDAFKKEVLDTAGTLQIVEIYSDWAGPCKAINGTCKRLYFDLGDKGLKFYTAAAGTLGFTAPYKGKCKPVFTFWKGGEELKELRLEGVNAPLFTKQIMAKLDEVA